MMTSEPVQWSDAMLTGVAEIDRQHRILVDTLNEAKVKLADGAFSASFEQITRDLLAYAIYHFDTEERLMRRHGYDTAAREAADLHLAQHRRFSEEIVGLRAAARRGEAGSHAALLSFLEDWLVNHILTTDKRLGRFICATTPASRAQDIG